MPSKDWDPQVGVRVSVGGQADDRSSLPTIIMTAGGFVSLITQRVVNIVLDVNSYPLPIKIAINGLSSAVPAFLSAALATTIAHYDVENRPALLKYNGKRRQQLANGQQNESRQYGNVKGGGYQGKRPSSTFSQRNAGRNGNRHNKGGYDHKRFTEIVQPPKQ